MKQYPPENKNHCVKLSTLVCQETLQWMILISSYHQRNVVLCSDIMYMCSNYIVVHCLNFNLFLSSFAFSSQQNYLLHTLIYLQTHTKYLYINKYVYKYFPIFKSAKVHSKSKTTTTTTKWENSAAFVCCYILFICLL